jgi:excisionase family DNA binding protein
MMTATPHQSMASRHGRWRRGTASTAISSDEADPDRRTAVDRPGTGERTEPAAASSPGLLLTIEEAADRLRVGRCTMQALVLSGDVRSFKIGRLRRIPPEALTEFIEQQLAR